MDAAERAGSSSGGPERGDIRSEDICEDRQARAVAALARAEAVARSARPGGSRLRPDDRLAGRGGEVDPEGGTGTDLGAGPGRRSGSGSGGRADRSAAADPDADSERVAHAICLRQLALAPRSRRQLHEKLRSKGCPAEVVDRVLDRLEAVGLIDDAAFAQTLVRTRRTTKGLASRALASELRAKGVPDDLVEGELAGISSEAERAQAYDWAAKKMRTMGGLSAGVQARRLAAFLARKGYPSGVVVTVVRDTVTAAPEHRRD